MAQWIDESGRSSLSVGLLKIYVRLNFEMNQFEAEIAGYEPVIYFDGNMKRDDVKRSLILKAHRLLEESIEGIGDVA